MRRAMVVSGSRALARTAAARAWAEEILRHAFAWWRPDLLVHGGCEDSPDAWSSEIVKADVELARRVAIRAFLVDGSIEPFGELAWTPVGFGPARWTSPEHVAAHPRHRRPLLRNGNMINAVGLEVETNDVRTLFVGLGAPWAEKHGTEHTTGLAKESKKMRVEYRKCPPELGP